MGLFSFNNKKIIIDIGTYFTKAVIVEEKLENGAKVNFSIEPSVFELDFSPLQESKVEDEEKFIETLRLAYSRLKTMEKNVFINIPDHFVIIRLITLKPEEHKGLSSKESLENAVLKKLKPSLPVNIDRWFFDMQMVDEIDGNKIFLIEAMLRSNLFEIERLVRKIGLNPVGVDINSFNCSNLFADYFEKKENHEKNISLVCINNKSTTIMIFRNGNLRTAQTRLIGGEDFIKRISEGKGISFKQAANVIHEETVFLPELAEQQDLIENYRYIKEVYSELIISLFNMFEYYTENFKESEIHEVIITGGLSNMSNIAENLEARLNIPVIRGSDIKHFRDKDGNDISQEDVNILASCVGSAFRD